MFGKVKQLLGGVILPLVVALLVTACDGKKESQTERHFYLNANPALGGAQNQSGVIQTHPSPDGAYKRVDQKAEKLMDLGKLKIYGQKLVGTFSKASKAKRTDCLENAGKGDANGKLNPSEQDLQKISNDLASLQTQLNWLVSQTKPDNGFVIFVAFVLTWVGMLALAFLIWKGKKKGMDAIKKDIRTINGNISDLITKNNRQEGGNNPVVYPSHQHKGIEDTLRVLEKRIALLETIPKPNNAGQVHDVPLKADSDGRLGLDKPSQLPTGLVTAIYSPAPDQEDNFDDGKFSGQITRDVLYEIFIGPDSDNAEFEFINQADIVNSALRYPKDLLFGACENINAFTQEAVEIITVKKGEAVRQGGKWHVTKKAKIRYEI